MFMPAHQIYGGELNEMYGDPGAKPALMRYKQAENVKYARDRAFDEQGVMTPLEMSPVKPGWTAWNRNAAGAATEPTLMEGHHRLAWAMNRDPHKELPITWTDKYSG